MLLAQLIPISTSFNRMHSNTLQEFHGDIYASLLHCVNKMLTNGNKKLDNLELSIYKYISTFEFE